VRDDPQEIADYLVSEHGLTEAMSVVGDSKTEAIQNDDNYRLSVLREVKVIIQNRIDAEDGNKGR
jgi:hypothetical protein